MDTNAAILRLSFRRERNSPNPFIQGWALEADSASLSRRASVKNCFIVLPVRAAVAFASRKSGPTAKCEHPELRDVCFTGRTG